MSAADAKRFCSELKAAKAPLMTIEAEWGVRSKCLQRIESLVRERGGVGCLASWPSWPAELAGLQRPLAAQLADLRSSILREACRTLLVVAAASPRDFEEAGALAFYAPLLWKGLYVTIKIMSQTSDDTLRELTSLAATTRSIPTFLTCLTDTHGVVREKCAAYITGIVAALPASTAAHGAEALAGLEAHLPSLLSAARAQMQATEGPVRASWRALWRELRMRFPGPHAAFDAAAAELPAPVLKALEQDRKAAASSTTSNMAGNKRKK